MGDDAKALTAFAELARGGNRAAQVFLGQVEPLTYLYSALSADLPRRDRIDHRPADHGAFLTELASVVSVTRMCDAACPDRVRTCMLVASFVTPDPLYLYTYSPVERAVGTEKYRAAPRFVRDMRELVETSPWVE